MIIVSSLEATTFFAVPNTERIDLMLSIVFPVSSLSTVAPVAIAKSSNVYFLLSPNAGALTAHNFNPFYILFLTNIARTSLSKSSAIRSKGLRSFTTSSNTFVAC